ncbi:MAG: hypothetical protein H0Z37_01770 [Firmicutes bacterium]|nr:hypothetical protein [Bacillota bacterium]
MDAQRSSPPAYPAEAWDDEIDLRQLVESLWRRRRLIIGLTVMAVLVAGVLSFLVLPPSYESSITVALPAADGQQVGMGPRAYEAFALSNRVLQSMIRLGSLDVTPVALESVMDSKLDVEPRLLTIPVRARTPEEAQELARLWYQAFVSETEAYVAAQIDEQLTVAEQNLAEWDSRLNAALLALSEFESATPLAVLESRLDRLQQDLVNVESRLRELNHTSIPTDEARMMALEEVLSQESEVIAGAGENVVLPVVDQRAGVTASGVTILNPMFLQLNQDLSSTRTRLATNRRAAELLQEQATVLPAEIDRLRSEIVSLKEQLMRLQREIDAVQPLADEARRERDRLLDLKRRIQQVATAPVSDDPPLPESPVSPRKMLNMAVAGVLAVFVGVGVALFQEFWAATDPAQSSSRERAEAG